MGNPVGFCFFLFFPGRKGNGSSFLFRRKEAKENHLRNVYFPLLLTVSPTCSAKRTAHIRAVRFLVSSWMCAKTPSVRNAPLSRYVFCFFSSRKEIVPLLFRRKEAKENHLPDLLLRFSLHFAQFCCAKRTAHIRAGRFFCFKLAVRENAFCSKCPPLSRYVFCFFSSRKEIVPLLFFLEEKKQKKIICRIGFCAFLCILRNPVAQNGRLTYEPAVFSLQAGCAGKRLLSEKPPQPLRLLFLFFKKRNRSPSFLFRRKEIVP